MWAVLTWIINHLLQVVKFNVNHSHIFDRNRSTSITLRCRWRNATSSATRGNSASRVRSRGHLQTGWTHDNRISPDLSRLKSAEWDVPPASIPFVFEALSLPDGEVYVSEFGINHEDAAQEAAVPVWRRPWCRRASCGAWWWCGWRRRRSCTTSTPLPTPYGLYLSNRWG